MSSLFKYENIATYANSLSTRVMRRPTMPLLKGIIHNHITRYKFSNNDYFTKKHSTSFTTQTVLDDVGTKKYGICMELNYAFYTFLKHYGYNCRLVKCYKLNGTTGNYYGVYHLGIVVKLPKDYFVDVGFGEYFTQPILLEDGKTTGDITVETNIPDNKYQLYSGDKYIFKIDDKDEPSLEDINKNYQAFFNGTDPEFPLCKYLFERIYCDQAKKYI